MHNNQETFSGILCPVWPSVRVHLKRWDIGQLFVLLSVETINQQIDKHENLHLSLNHSEN